MKITDVEIIHYLLAISMALGMSLLLTQRAVGLGLLSIGLNLYTLAVATPGHPLSQSLALTAIVIGAGTFAMYIINSSTR